MKQALKYPIWGSFFSQKQEIWSSEVAYCLLPEGQSLCGGALLSLCQDRSTAEPAFRGGSYLSFPTVGTARSESESHGPSSPQVSPVSSSAQLLSRGHQVRTLTHALVGGGSLFRQREGLLPAARGETGQSGKKNPLQRPCAFSPVAGMCSEGV